MVRCEHPSEPGLTMWDLGKGIILRDSSFKFKKGGKGQAQATSRSQQFLPL